MTRPPVEPGSSAELKRPLLLPAVYFVLGLAWFLGATLAIPLLAGEAGPTDVIEALADLALFLVVVVLAARFELRYRAAVRRALDERAATEYRVRSLLEASPAVILVVGHDGWIASAYGRAESILGYETTELIGQPLEILAPAEPSAASGLLRAAVMDDSAAWPAERHVTARRKDGSTIPVEILRSTLAANGTPRMMATIVDITERQRAAEALERQATSFRLLFASNPLPMWVFDPASLAFLEVNDAAVIKYGYSREAFLAMRITDIRPPEDLDRLLGDVAAPGPALRPTGEWRHRTKDGELIDVEVDAHDLDFNDRPARLVVARDVTRRKRALAALQESEERFRQITESIRECFWLRDAADGSLIYLSPAFEEIWGRPMPELPSTTPLVEGTHPDDLARIREATDDLTTIWDRPLEFRIVRPDGAIRQIRSRRFPVLDESGRLHRIAGVAEDVTDEVALGNRIRQVEKMESINQLASGIVHDFSNILTAVRGFAELIASAAPAQDPRDDAREIVTAADRGAALTRQLLAFNRQQILEPRTLDLGEHIAGLRALIQRLVGEHIVLKTFSPPDLDTSRVDPVQLEQVLLNLAANARDAMPEGGQLTIETANAVLDANYAAHHPGVTPGRYVAISVTDTGAGMDPSTAARAFEPFFTTKATGRGTGLGLATVYGIAKQSGGHVDIYSELGRGTMIRVYLPSGPGETEAASVTAEEPATITGSETILLVEDDDAIRSFVERALSELGYRVLAAASGPEALELAARTEGRIELLITDVVMPELSGHELADRLLVVRPDLRVVYVSGYTENSVVRNGILAKGVSFIPKPFTIDTLGRTVRRVLDSVSSS